MRPSRSGSGTGAAPDVVGYADPLCVTAGDEVAVAVSSLSERYSAQLVRFGGDEQANVVAEPLEWEHAGEHPGKVQGFDRGSYLRVPDAEALAELDTLGFSAWVYPTRGSTATPAIVSLGRAWRFGLDERCRLTFWHGDHAIVSTPTSLQAREWYAVGLTIDRAGARVTLSSRQAGRDSETAQESSDALSFEAGETELLLAAARLPDGRVGHHFNGKLEQPRISDEALGDPEAPLPEPYAAWDLSPRDGVEIPDVGVAGLDGELVNGPTRCVTGHAWRGRELDWRQVPAQYSAIHFHDDDLDDARWEVDLRWRTPPDLRSGVYAVHVRGESGEDHVPFVVSPPPGAETRDIGVLIPSFSYLVYANEHNAWYAPTFEVAGLDRTTLLELVSVKDHFVAEQRLLSCYELHSDGSGVSMASSRRPLLNMRPGYVSPIVRGPHQLAADLELLAWMEAEGFEHGVVSDHHLHAHGVEALRHHKVIVLGSHPEYWSEAMLDALAEYQEQGGRVIYLGGNGLYWVTAQDPARPWVVEVRRGHSGTRCWTSEPGEVHLQTTGEPGGLWRYRGRAPQQLVGVGFTAQGFDVSLPYRATDAARDPRAAFLFEGIDPGEPIGDAGSVMDGAAGYELDRADVLLGTPAHALVVARAEGFSDAYQAASEEIVISDSLQGGPVNDRVRADVTFYETPAGGAVLGVGSIAFCGALGANGGKNPLSRLIANAIRGFVTRDFEMPASGT